MRALSLVIAASLTSGCASIISDQVYPVRVTSEPTQANYEIRDQDGVVVSTGTTPDTVSLSSNAGFFDGEKYTFRFQKEGYNEGQFLLNSGIDGWYWANILFGGLLGMVIIDPATGAMYDLPGNASANLSPLAVAQAVPAASVRPATSSISTTRNAPTGALSKQQQINQLMKQNLGYEEYQRRYKEIMGE